MEYFNDIIYLERLTVNDIADVDFVIQSNKYIKPEEKEAIKRLEKDAWLIKLLNNNQTIGLTWLSKHLLSNKEETYISIEINSDHFGHGYGMMALKLLIIKYAFGELKLQRLLAEISRYNAQSLKVFGKIGFNLLLDETISGTEFAPYELKNFLI